MSLDTDEINKFDNLADKWWDESGEFAALHEINPLRIRYVRDIISQHYPNAKPSELSVLDAGCGGGLLSVPLARIGYNIDAVDASVESIKALQAKILSLQLGNLSAEYIEDGTLPDKSYDVVICVEVLEHVVDLSAFITELTKRVKSGGIIILSTINRTPKSFMHAIAAAEYILGWVPRGTHEYKKFIRPAELYHLLEDNNIKVTEQQGLEYHLMTRSWRMTDNLDVNYFVYGQKH